MPTQDEFNAFLAALNVHDWWFEFTSDQAKYEAGRDRQKQLEDLSVKHQAFQEAFSAYHELKFGEGSETYRTLQFNERIEALSRRVKRHQLEAA